jgi:hypothetical protein
VGDLPLFEIVWRKGMSAKVAAVERSDAIKIHGASSQSLTGFCAKRIESLIV